MWKTKFNNFFCLHFFYEKTLIYLSNDAIFDNSDTYLGGVANFSALNGSGDTYTNSATFTLPQGITGNYRIIVITDRYNYVNEEDNSNNTGISTSTTSITLTPPPDLQVTSILVPNNAFSGTNINVQWTVTNEGTGQTLENFWRDRVYLTTDSTLTIGGTNTYYLGYRNRNSTLAADSSYTQTLAANLPNNIFDTFFVYVVTDIYNHVYEHANESNNTERSTPINIILTPPPDLTITAITLPDTASNTENITVSWTVFNQGGTAPLNGWYDRIYLSSIPNDTVFNTAILSQSYYRQNNLNPGQSYTQTKTIKIPSTWTGGVYLYVVTDINNGIFEYTNEYNNTSRSADSLLIITPDLIIGATNAPASASSGDTITIDFEILNTGLGDVLNGNWNSEVYLSTSATYNSSNLTLLETVNNSGDLLSGDTIQNQVTAILPNGTSGQYYIWIKTDIDDDVYETDNDNNVNTASIPLQINLSPWIDLTPTAITPQSSINAGAALSLSYTVMNNGTKPTSGQSWQDKIYMSSSSTWNPASAQLLKTISQNQSLGLGSSYTEQTTVAIPLNTPTGVYYMHIVTDAGNAIYEYTFENNNRLGSTGFSVVGYPPVDLALINAIAPVNSMSGSSATIQWEVKNISNFSTISSYWYDAIYLSSDTILQTNTDILLGSWQQYGPTDSSATYINSQSVNIPNGLSGQYYFIVVADYNQQNNDSDIANNRYVIADSLGNSIPIVITLTPPADLVPSNFTAPAQGTSGQPIEIIYTVTNNGTGPTTSGNWKDNIYLSTDFVLGNDIQIATITHTGNLNIGESYTDTIQAFIPISVSGNRIIIIKTDNNNAVYEHTDEGNNTATAPITIIQPPPSDVVVSTITSPDSAIAGESITINYMLENQGSNPAVGTQKTAIYLSKDTIWDINDALVGLVSGYINLAPQAQINQSITADLTGVALDDYYTLVRADILNNIFESNDTNNTTISSNTTNVNVRELPINILTADNLDDNKELYYRIHVPDSLAGETLLITLKGDSIAGANELYLRFGDIPTRVVYDYKDNSPFSGNQEVIIPSLQQGDYYLMGYGSTSNGNTQAVTLLAEILNFEIRSVNANSGGNTGTVTVQVNGAKFDSTMVVGITNGNTTIYVDALQYINPTQIYVTFDLTGATIGKYDVFIEKFTGDSTGLVDGFEVVNGFDDLQVNVIKPNNTRPNQIVSIRIEFSNNGNNDIINPIAILKSVAGAYIGFTIPDLDNYWTQLNIPLIEANGPQNILRPKASGSITVYAKANEGLGFTLYIPNN